MKWIITLTLTYILLPPAAAQSVRTIKLPQLNELLKKQNDTTYVLNFWATWCKPCVKELPAFDSLHLRFRDKKAKVLLISLDDARQLESKVVPFVVQRAIKAETVLLDETDYNRWIDIVEPSWGGAIPATLIYNHHHRYRRFIEGETNFKALAESVSLSLKLSTGRK